MSKFQDLRTYRVTGPQSIVRLDPIVKSFLKLGHWVQAHDPTTECRIDFVWETACEKCWRTRHFNALILNKLHNTAVLESKSNLAFLQQIIPRPMLPTFVAASGIEVVEWATRKWTSSTFDTRSRDIWAVKAADGNGGKDVWFIDPDNYQKVCQEFPSNTEFVIQKYVQNPLLYNGKKFHFRCYSMLTATNAAYVYEKGFILSAGLDYDVESDDPRTHITNLSVNKHMVGHPGQVPSHISKEYPMVTWLRLI